MRIYSVDCTQAITPIQPIQVPTLGQIFANDGSGIYLGNLSSNPLAMQSPIIMAPSFAPMIQPIAPIHPIAPLSWKMWRNWQTH